MSENQPLKINWKKGLQGSGVQSFSVETVNTKPPELYNGGTLITAMTNVDRLVENPNLKKILKDADGIGTPATRGSIIDSLETREWIEVTQKGMQITAKGAALLDQIPEKSGFKDVVISAYWEMALKKIEISGSDDDAQEFYEQMVKATHELVELFKNQGKFTLPGSEFTQQSVAPLKDEGVVCATCNQGKMKTLQSKSGLAFLKCQNTQCAQAIFPEDVWGKKDFSNSTKKDVKPYKKQQSGKAYKKYAA